MKSITKLSRIILIYMNHFKLRIGKSTVLSRILTGAGLSGADASRVHHKSMPGYLLCKSSGLLNSVSLHLVKTGKYHVLVILRSHSESRGEHKGNLIGARMEEAQ